MINKLNEILSEYGVPDILEIPEYKYEGFDGDDDLFTMLDEIRDNNCKVLVHGDSDPDGAFGSKIVLEALDRVNHSNYEFYKYRERSHVLTVGAVNYCIYNKFDVMIIIDSSSSDMKNIKKLCTFGIKVIIIDHHQCIYNRKDYPSNCLVLNTILENRFRGEEKFILSGGSLTFYLLGEYLSRRSLRFKDLSAYALLTLYSDSVDMTRPLNRAIYYMAVELDHTQLPIYVRHFFHSYDAFRRRFIEFTFIPKINAIFRAERLDLVNSYLFEEHTVEEYTDLVKQITDVHESSRNMVNIATDVVKKEAMNNIVIANLSNTSIPIMLNKLYNYTGLVANNLSTDFGKPCVVLCDTGTEIKGSFRDCLSRNYLKIFQQFCKAEGHNSAFAISLQYHEFSEFMYYIREKIDKKFFILGVDEPIEIEYEQALPDVNFLRSVALYNEFSGVRVPIASIKKKNTFKFSKSYSKTTSYKYHWGEFKIDSSSFLPPNYEFNIKPVLTKKIKLVVYSRSVIL